MKGRLITVVLLISVSISLAISVSYWMGGISNQFRGYEKLGLESAYCDYKSAYHNFNGINADSWEIKLYIKNTGTKEASISGVFVNEKAISDYGSGDTTDWIVAFDGSLLGSPIDFENGGEIRIDPGSTKEIIILIAVDSGSAYSFAYSGGIIVVSFKTGAGVVYPRMITLL